MSQFEPGTYIILPVVASDKGIAVGPIPRIFPPPDVPAKILYQEQWLIRDSGEDNTFTVFAGKGRDDDYKWIVKNGTDLYLSSTNQSPGSFRIEPAGDGVWIIGIPNQDLLLTADLTAYPSLTFNPADGSEAQRFAFVRVDN